MRIIGGKAKGRRIVIPAGREIRPSLQIVRKSIFDSLGEEVKEARILDLFAGAGSLGLEALSRGSQEVTFVDKNRKVIKNLRENANLLGFHKQTRLVNADAIKSLHRLWKNGIEYDIVFADPPYTSNLVSKTVEALAVCDILRTGGVMIIEHPKHIDLPSKIGSLMLWKMKEFGETHVSFFRKHKE